MADLKAEKAELDRKLQEVKDELARLERRAAKLDKVQNLDEFEPGTVLMFSRPLAGGSKKYTFVAFRTWDGPAKWAVTGKANTLNLLGLSEAGNTWKDLLLAIGDAKIKVASSWRTVGSIEYFRGAMSGNLYRILPGSSRAETTDSYNRAWRSSHSSADHVRSQPFKFNPVGEDQVPLDLRS